MPGVSILPCVLEYARPRRPATVVHPANPVATEKLRHVCDGRLLRRGKHFETVASAILMPSFSNWPWMHGAPHMLAVAMRLMSLRIWGSMPGRPPLDRVRQVQYRRNPPRCHVTTVAGFTITKAPLQLVHRRESRTYSPRSTLARRSRLTERCNTPSCWQSARISPASRRRVLKKASAAKTDARMRFSTANDRCAASVRPQRSRAGRGFQDPQPVGELVTDRPGGESCGLG
jgi:hypothetical protein